MRHQVYINQIIFKKVAIVICLFICLQIISGQDLKLLHNGHERDYKVHVPENLNSEELVPLLIHLHGYSGTGVGYNGRNVTLANEKGFIGVFPTALPDGSGNNMWNAGGKYEDWTNSDDVGFISALIDLMISDYSVDSLRVYVTGGSNGGYMAFRLAAELSHKIAAAAPYVGQMMYEFCDPKYTVPILYTHGMQDKTVPYEGKDFYGFPVPPVEDVIATWGKINGCSSEYEIIIQNNKVTGKKWASPDGKSDVLLYTYNTLGHSWPTVENCGVDGNPILWDFLSKQQLQYKPRFYSSNILSTLKGKLQIFPNPASRYIQISDLKKSSTPYRIINIVGNDTKHGVLSETNTINISTLSKGIYFLQLKIEGVWVSKKFLVE